MTPIQQLMLGVGASKKTYMDDLFSTYVYKGNSTARSINNGINLSGEGGMTWIKMRDGNISNRLYDTERGATKSIYSNLSNSEGTDSEELSSFNTNGFSLGTRGAVNDVSNTFSSWTFRKAPGFFTCLTYVGSGSNRTISHDLNCVPGLIIIKRTDTASDWRVYHRGSGATKYLTLNENYAAGTHSSYWQDTAPTASVFSLGTDGDINASGGEYIAYLFAGGESTNALARSIELDGSNDYFQTSASTDFEFTGDFTFECWFKTDTISGKRGIFNLGESDAEGGFEVYHNGTDLGVDNKDGQKFRTEAYLSVGQWYHIAFVRSGSAISLYLNGTYFNGYTDSSDYGINSGGNRSYFMMGTGFGGAVEHYFDGHISNVRVLNGTALYTSSFRPPTEPLTNITNTKLLCCNNSSVTGSTVAPTTLTASGVTASTDSPFDDPAGFVFGESGSENVIKCGSYVGSGSAGLEVNVGFESQWVLWKRTDSTGNWFIHDSMRGIVTGGDDPYLLADVSDAENPVSTIDVTPTGFKITTSGTYFNASGGSYIWMAIRRSDGYCGKPPELGTDVFAMDTGNSSSTIPCFDSGFPVDLALLRTPASESSWYATARLIENRYLFTDTTAAESTASTFTFDSNTGWQNNANDSTWLSWMWKRHAGFDVVTYEGNGVAGRQVPHSMNKTVEMMWLKNRSSSSHNWMCYHKGLNGGTNPEDYFLRLNTADAEGSSSTYLNSTAPTSTNITLGSINAINANGSDFIAMLFASVDGISKVGYYDAADTDVTVSVGFQPRFVIVKKSNGGDSWVTFDTVRGWATTDNGISQRLTIDGNVAQANDQHTTTLTSDGFIAETGSGNMNGGAGGKYIYYCHA